jgi:hypothetical protein
LNLKPSLNLDLKNPIEKEIEKGIRKSREKEKGKAAQPAQVSAARPRARAPAPPDRWTPPVSGSFPLRAPSLAHCPVGPTCRRRFPSPALSLSLSLSRGPGPLVTEPLPRTPLSSLSTSWACPVSSAPSALAMDRRMRTRARHRISRPRRPLTRPAPFLEPHQCPAHTPRLISLSFTLSRALPSPPAATETHARVPDHLARPRPLQASPSSAPR